MAMWQWWTPDASGAAPANRTGHAAALLAPDVLVVAGGWNGAKCFDDAHALDLGGAPPGDRRETAEIAALRSRTARTGLGGGAPRWHELSLERIEGASLNRRVMFGYAALDGVLYIHGGWDNENLDNTLDDVIKLSPSELRAAGDTWAGTVTAVPTTGDGPERSAAGPQDHRRDDSPRYRRGGRSTAGLLEAAAAKS